MIGISKLYMGQAESSDALRYGRDSSKLPSHLLQFSQDKKPVVVWNVTQRCNLKCEHCYAHATNRATPDELTTDEGKALIDDLAAGLGFLFGRRQPPAGCVAAKMQPSLPDGWLGNAARSIVLAPPACPIDQFIVHPLQT